MRYLLILATAASLAFSGAALAQSSMSPDDHPGSGTNTPGSGVAHEPRSHHGMKMGRHHHRHMHRHHMMHKSGM